VRRSSKRRLSVLCLVSIKSSVRATNCWNIKLIDEILVNAADNIQRDKKTTTIKVTIDQKQNRISVWNNGKGIPIEMHKDHGCYVPELVFGHLLTSSNYDDKQKKVTGGRNGYGAKLTNIFSKRFTVETQDSKKKKHYF
jgi:DNA topoisomerase-2